MKYYKFITKENLGAYSGFNYSEYLPKNGKPGKWLPKLSNITVCLHGYHACTSKSCAVWVDAQLYEVELQGDIVVAHNKVVAERIRFIRKIDQWDERNQRLFSCWCARRALPIYEAGNAADAIAVALNAANAIALAASSCSWGTSDYFTAFYAERDEQSKFLIKMLCLDEEEE